MTPCASTWAPVTPMKTDGLRSHSPGGYQFCAVGKSREKLAGTDREMSNRTKRETENKPGS